MSKSNFQNIQKYSPQSPNSLTRRLLQYHVFFRKLPVIFALKRQGDPIHSKESQNLYHTLLGNEQFIRKTVTHMRN